MAMAKLTAYQLTILTCLSKGPLFVEEVRYPSLLILERAGLVVRKRSIRLWTDRVWITDAGRAALNAGAEALGGGDR
jgi:hypothetical protein